jgi:hypothetical protein
VNFPITSLWVHHRTKKSALLDWWKGPWIFVVLDNGWVESALLFPSSLLMAIAESRSFIETIPKYRILLIRKASIRSIY